MTLQEIWDWVNNYAPAIGVIFAVIGGIVVFVKYILPRFRRDGGSGNGGGPGTGVVKVVVSPEGEITISIDRLLEKARLSAQKSPEEYREPLREAAQPDEALNDQVRQLTDAVQALADQRGELDAPPGIDEALRLLAEGKTEASEAIFEQVKKRRKAEGAEALKEAAVAACHIGALAFLHDTQKALAAYREAVALDPDNAAGWNQLGHLLRRTGDLDRAEQAYNRVLALGNTMGDREVVAAATSNLGNL